MKHNQAIQFILLPYRFLWYLITDREVRSKNAVDCLLLILSAASLFIQTVVAITVFLYVQHMPQTP